MGCAIWEWPDPPGRGLSLAVLADRENGPEPLAPSPEGAYIVPGRTATPPRSLTLRILNGNRAGTMAGGKALVSADKLTEPVSKLIGAVQSAIGTLYEPTRIHREAKAQAGALIISTEAQITRNEMLYRAAQRIGTQETHRQENIDVIVDGALRALPASVSPDPMDPDWVSRFFESCQDVSETQLQAIWSKLLAGEVARPGACSRRTLTVLRDLSPLDASRFRELCRYAWHNQNVAFVPEEEEGRSFAEKFDWDFGDSLALEAAGLFRIDSVNFRMMRGARLSYHHSDFRVIPDGELAEVGIPVCPFSPAGVELRPIVQSNPHPTYAKSVTEWLRDARKATISEWSEGPGPTASPPTPH